MMSNLTNGLRGPAVTLVLLAGLGLAATPAVAGPEVVTPEPIEFTDTFPPGFPCEFTLEAQVSGKGGAILFDDRAIITSPGLTVTLTNLESGEAVTYAITGVLHDTFIGDVLRTKMTGRNILFGVIDGEPGMFLTIGKIVIESPADDLFTVDVIEEESPATMIDVCTVLGG